MFVMEACMFTNKLHVHQSCLHRSTVCGIGIEFCMAPDVQPQIRYFIFPFWTTCIVKTRELSEH